MVRLNEQIKIGKLGINYVTNVVDESNCNFHEMLQENDVGIDGQIELFTEEGIPTGRIISAQVKTGKSYYDLEKQECIIPVNGHAEYWLNFQLPVIGIVCILNDEYRKVILAYWVDIKAALLKREECSVIRFKMCKHNEFSKDKFRKYFYYLINHDLPILNFNEAKVLFAGNEEDRKLAIDELQINHANHVESWKLLFDLYEKNSGKLDESMFFDAVSYVFSHPDKWRVKGKYEFSIESSEYVTAKISEFLEKDIIRAIRNIDQHFFDRGTIGQTIEIIISNISEADKKLLNIIMDKNIGDDIRFDAEMILAFQYQEVYLNHIEEIRKMNSEITGLIYETINKFGCFELY